MFMCLSLCWPITNGNRLQFVNLCLDFNFSCLFVSVITIYLLNSVFVYWIVQKKIANSSRICCQLAKNSTNWNHSHFTNHIFIKLCATHRTLIYPIIFIMCCFSLTFYQGLLISQRINSNSFETFFSRARS